MMLFLPLLGPDRAKFRIDYQKILGLAAWVTASLVVSTTGFLVLRIILLCLRLLAKRT